jgi:hypothetical protein
MGQRGIVRPSVLVLCVVIWASIAGAQAPTCTPIPPPCLPTPTVCPLLSTVSGPVYRSDGSPDVNDSVWFTSDLTRATVIGACVYDPVAALSTTTDAHGMLVPIQLAQGMPVGISLANGEGSPVHVYIPYEPTVLFADLVNETMLSSVVRLDNLGVPITDVSKNDHSVTNLGGVQFNLTTFAGLPVSPAVGTVLYCSDCQPIAACVGGGTGALAIFNGGWQCHR